MLFEPPPPMGRSAWQELADHIRDLILEGVYAPGERLIETELAERFDVSRGPVRSALAWLDRTGLVVVSPKRGTRVVNLTAEAAREIYDVRRALEVLAIKTVPSPEPDLTAVQAALQRLSDASAGGASLRNLREADLALHRQLCIDSGNSRLLAAWDALADQIRLVITTVQRMTPETVGPILEQHADIVDALVRHDRDAAAAAAERHLAASQDAMAASLLGGDARRDPEEQLA
jgi:DNA-binding GntR family transcriptional regulator